MSRIALKIVALALLLLPLAPARAQTSPAPLLLFGGAAHRTLLGCLNCGQLETDSVCNQFGPFGSPESLTSIWNAQGIYGSPFSLESPWNKIAENGPLVYDKAGRPYGFFSANPNHPNRVKVPALLQLLDEHDQAPDLAALRNLYCGG